LAEHQRVAIRFDASAATGGGHAVRCLALSDALAGGGAEILLLVNPDAQALLAGLGTSHAVLPVGAGGAAAAKALEGVWPEGAGLAIVDHYGWSSADERHLRSVARRVVVIDDLADRAHDCDLLVDQNAGRSVRDYAGLVGPEIPLLIGPRFALLRPAFGSLREEAVARRSAPDTGTPRETEVLIALGLSDPADVLLSLCEALSRSTARARFRIVLSPSVASHPGIAGLSARDPRFVPMGLQDAARLAQLMAIADLAIGGAGVTAWERCTLGLPSLVLVLAANQRAGAEALAEAGAAMVFEPDADGFRGLVRAFERLAHLGEARSAMARAALRITDGRGALRVAAACGDMMSGLRVRPAGLDDGEDVWRWRNAPGARAASRVTDEIPLTAHLDWYARAITSPRRVILIGEMAGAAVGMVRFDETAPGTWDVSIALDPLCAGRGLGTLLLRRACAWMEADRSVGRLTATARATNDASLRLFARMGFRLGKPTDGWVAMTTEGHLHGNA
jgi:UDP-2,4-diacetamido-2,4,6-trideoxy-beta-L-altropyranose hydrolase